MKESGEFEMFSEVFTETFNSLTENESVILNTFGNCECISLPKEDFQETETEKEDIKEQFHQFKNDFLDDFNEFKTKFLHEVKSFTDNILNTTHPAGTRHLQDILRVSWNCLVSIRHFQDIYKTSSCRWLVIDISKMS